jgi:4-hydroxy-tetrahydrodipicolinate reductase
MGLVSVGLLGLGGVGRQVARLLLEHRRDFELVGAVSLDQGTAGRTVAAVAGTDGGAGEAPVFDSLDDLLARRPQVVIDASRSFLPAVGDDLVRCVRAGANVVSCCEELAFPLGRNLADGARIDAEARAAGVTVLGTGVNPGFIFDSLVLTCTGLAWDVTSISGRRVVDVAGFSRDIHRRLGIGYTPEAFERGHADGSIAGHVGFPESIAMVAEGVGLDLDQPVKQTFVPYVADSPAPTVYGEVPAGQTEGFLQTAVGRVAGAELIRFELLLHLRPQEVGATPGDTISVEGLHPVRLSISPGMSALQATSAHLVNSCATVLLAPSGLHAVKDLPPAAAWLGGLGRVASAQASWRR